MAQKTSRPHAPPTLSVKGRDVRIRTIGLVVLAGLVIWFIAVNTESVGIRLWVTTVTLPLWAVLTVTLLVGLIMGGILAHRRAKR
ncbi:LapA family protein [Streptomyces sp. NPDC056178]|uniref:LapA family protein n=1 Tax=unclassified Streptomyces TaxID=2593676 RepID=UPI0035D8B11C